MLTPATRTIHFPAAGLATTSSSNGRVVWLPQPLLKLLVSQPRPAVPCTFPDGSMKYMKTCHEEWVHPTFTYSVDGLTPEGMMTGTSSQSARVDGLHVAGLVGEATELSVSGDCSVIPCHVQALG